MKHTALTMLTASMLVTAVVGIRKSSSSSGMVLHSPITRIRIHTRTNLVFTPSPLYTVTPAMTAMPIPATTNPITTVTIDPIDTAIINPIDIGDTVDGERHILWQSDQPRWRYQGVNASGLSPRVLRNRTAQKRKCRNRSVTALSIS